MGNGIVREVQDIESFKRFSSEYDRMRTAGLSAEEIHGVLLARIQNSNSIVSNDVVDFKALPRQKSTVSSGYEEKNNDRIDPPMKADDKRSNQGSSAVVSSTGAESQMMEISKPKKSKTVGLALLIDDSAVAAKVASKVLSNAQFDVVTANSAKMGFDILLGRKDEINVIFLDVVMPNVDGVECLSWIKDNADVSHIPVYMLSGLEDQMLAEVCVERGAEGMLLKPLNVDTVRTIIRSHGIGNDPDEDEVKAAPEPPPPLKSAPSFSRPAPLVIESIPSPVNVVPKVAAPTPAPPASVIKGNDSPTNKSKKAVSPARHEHPYNSIANAAPPNTTVSGLIPAFKLVDSEFSEFVYPASSAKKLTLLLFIPTVYCPALYEEDGFLMRLFHNYDLLMNTKHVGVACISGDLPFALAAAKHRFRIPFTLLSDPSLFVTQKLMGAMNVGPALAYQELLHRHQDDDDSDDGNSRAKGPKELDNETLKQILVTAMNPQQMFYGPRLGMLLLSRKREVLHMWQAPLPPIAKHQLQQHPKDINFRQFPNNFKEWITLAANGGVREGSYDEESDETPKARGPPGRLSQQNSRRKSMTSSISPQNNTTTQQGHTESKERDRDFDIFRPSRQPPPREPAPVLSEPLPLAVIERAPPEPEKPKEKTAILVIDDSSVSSRVVCRKLESLGYLVHAAYDGQKGFDMLRKRAANYAIILCDVVMPICDGIGFLKLTKNDDEVKHIPVVMLSGLEGEELNKSCLELGAYSLLKKPFDEQRFSEIVVELGIPPPT
jgi:CheY-like chemotaxis protein